ncbi:hypothetical protein C8R47DRAFT_571702 [Mycena vitilis]|nr:hypothetical protein C8R47DRAFT_571702 [Mycena vitilis]
MSALSRGVQFASATEAASVKSMHVSKIDEIRKNHRPCRPRVSLALTLAHRSRVPHSRLTRRHPTRSARYHPRLSTSGLAKPSFLSIVESSSSDAQPSPPASSTSSRLTQRAGCPGCRAYARASTMGSAATRGNCALPAQSMLRVSRVREVDAGVLERKQSPRAACFPDSGVSGARSRYRSARCRYDALRAERTSRVRYRRRSAPARLPLQLEEIPMGVERGPSHSICRVSLRSTTRAGRIRRVVNAPRPPSAFSAEGDRHGRR